MIIENFKQITKISRCSGKTEKMREFLIEYSKHNSFEVNIDKAGNILATCENPKLCFQSHYDMVCIGDYQNIEIIEENGFLRAKNSTLGADNGVGIAIMMELMKKYKNCEYLFTNDEEIGLIGAYNLELEIKSKSLINLDSEDENIYMGCAGGFDVEIEFSNRKSEVKTKSKIYKIEVAGLAGGHSGVDIDKDIPNAIKELGKKLNENMKIVSIKGGERRNSIPVNCVAYVLSDENLDYPNEEKESVYFIESEQIIRFIKSVANGVRGYSKEFEVVNKSLNLALIDDEKVVLSARGNSNEILEDFKDEIEAYLKLFNLKYRITDDYPAWKPKMSRLVSEYQKITNQNIKVIHAGLECAIFTNSLNSDMMSIGPNIYEPHSIRERVEIKSIYRVYEKIEQFMKLFLL